MRAMRDHPRYVGLESPNVPTSPLLIFTFCTALVAARTKAKPDLRLQKIAVVGVAPQANPDARVWSRLKTRIERKA